ncbi:helix-turn-helix domain-containing protein [Gorillibacterium sp. sgz5001074]|uniref:helix-turn-helix domain-containing protein n=1 Tax=Gorillibacterium sp. sgz5001074 TaxID=3446695 RepID=UPI003F67A559
MKLLIIDDECQTRDLLQQFVAWEEIGISEVAAAKNGIMALAVAKELCPDIILCDVRMPKMNGIEFATAYRREDPSSQIIFLSGFSDKEYLKSAIHLKALSYLEKPINLDEVRRTVEEAVALRREERRTSLNARVREAELDRSLSVLRQEMVKRLISNPSGGHTLQALRNTDTFLLPPRGPYSVAVASLYWSPPDHPENPVMVQERMLDLIGQHPRLQRHQVLAGFDDNNYLVLIFPGSFGSAYQTGRKWVEDLQDELKKMAGPMIDLRLGLGEPAAELMEIPRAYRQAWNATAYHFYTDGQSPVFASDMGKSGSPLQTDWDKIRRLRDGLRKGDIQGVKETIRRWTARARAARDLDIPRVKDTYFQMLLAVTDTAVQLGVAEDADNVERRYIWKELDRLPSLDLLEAYLLSSVESFDTPAEEGMAGSGKIREIIRFTHAHFHEKGFGIPAIAKHVKLSENYLCSYFKKQRGQTIKEFITETKLEKAKELLREPDMKLYEVATRLGFADANYFTTFFKRYEGMTPSEYRDRWGG